MAVDRRRRGADQLPSGLGNEPVGNAGQRILGGGVVTNDSPLADGGAPDLELWFDKREQPCTRRRKIQNRRQDLRQRDEGGIADDELRRLREIGRNQMAGIDPFA